MVTRQLTKGITRGVTRDIVEPFNYFIFTVKTDNAGTSNNDQFEFPLVAAGTYDFTATASDGTVFSTDNYTNNIMTFDTGAGVHEIVVTGTIEGWSLDNGNDSDKFLNVSQWGVLDGNMYHGFYGCSNMTITATDIPKFASIGSSNTSFNDLFNGCSSLTTIPNSNLWYTGNITDFKGLFNACPLFNSDISSWDVSSVTTFSSLFRQASSFNQDISGWNTSSVTDFTNCFNAATSFTYNVGSWDTGLATSVVNMFLNVGTYDYDLSGFDFSNVTNASGFFQGATMSTTNYDLLLVSLGTQSLQSGVTFAGGTQKYTGFSSAGTAHTKLRNQYSWTMSDGGADINAGTTLWLDSFDETTITDSSGSVSQWDDKSDTSNDATGTGSARPTTGTRTQNSRNVIDFTTNDTLILASNDVFDQPFTMFVVAKVDSNSSNMAIITRQSGATDGGYNLRDVGSGTFQSFAVGPGPQFSVPTQTSNTNTNLHVSTFDLTSRYHINDETESVGATLSGYDNSITTAASIGATSGGSVNFLDGFVAEIIMLDSVLSGSEIDEIKSYLNTKWSIY